MKQVLINLPVEDVERSMKFYAQLGFTSNPVFTDDEQKCMVWCEQVYVMLMPRARFQSFSHKPVADTKGFAAAYFTLPVESLERMNEIVESGLKAGGIEPIAMKDHGFMQLRRIEDYDGNFWDVIYLDMEKFPKG